MYFVLLFRIYRSVRKREKQGVVTINCFHRFLFFSFNDRARGSRCLHFTRHDHHFARLALFLRRFTARESGCRIDGKKVRLEGHRRYRRSFKKPGLVDTCFHRCRKKGKFRWNLETFRHLCGFFAYCEMERYRVRSRAFFFFALLLNQNIREHCGVTGREWRNKSEIRIL